MTSSATGKEPEIGKALLTRIANLERNVSIFLGEHILID